MNQVSTETQVSAGGVVFARRGEDLQIVLISVGAPARWQLPKGLAAPGESLEETARREVREETGLETELIAPLDKIQYWYYATSRGQRVRFHKYVHFYLFRYTSGDVNEHDDEVNEARWVEIDEAYTRLAFASEKKIVEKARALIPRFA